MRQADCQQNGKVEDLLFEGNLQGAPKLIGASILHFFHLVTLILNFEVVMKKEL